LAGVVWHGVEALERPARRTQDLCGTPQSVLERRAERQCLVWQLISSLATDLNFQVFIDPRGTYAYLLISTIKSVAYRSYLMCFLMFGLWCERPAFPRALEKKL
jgi:hypothetical protein